MHRKAIAFGAFEHMKFRAITVTRDHGRKR
jgi:hypothetical protein